MEQIESALPASYALDYISDLFITRYIGKCGRIAVLLLKSTQLVLLVNAETYKTSIDHKKRYNYCNSWNNELHCISGLDKLIAALFVCGHDIKSYLADLLKACDRIYKVRELLLVILGLYITRASDCRQLDVVVDVSHIVCKS